MTLFSRSNLPTSRDSAMQCYCVLETSPVSIEDDRTLRAQVHDALWMLTEQWRVGEFRGEDAGSPMQAKIETEQILINRFRGRSTETEAYAHQVPLEANTERLPLIPNLYLRIQMGNFLLAKLQTLAFVNVNDFLTQYPLPTIASTAYEELSDTRYRSILSLAAGKVMDGYEVYMHLKKNSANRIYDGVTPATAYTSGEKSSITQQVQGPFMAWVNRLYYTPEVGQGCWSPEQLEYQFRISAPKTSSSTSQEIVLTADQYDNGSLDWYSFDEVSTDTNIWEGHTDTFANDKINGTDDIHSNTFETFIPSPVSFKGMPNERWWEFEDKNIDLAKLIQSRNDIMGLSLIDFAQNYGNDWFLLPHSVRNGSLVKVKNLVVTDTFGKSYLIENASNHQASGWRGWKMFATAKRGATDTSEYMLVAPTLIKTVESEPIEIINFFRDEEANLVWGVENTIPDLWNGSRTGKDAYLALQDYFFNFPPPPNATPATYEATEAELAYKLMNQVPEYWIPFIPIHKDFNQRAINFQRGAFLRFINDEATLNPVKPRSSLLSHKINPTPTAPAPVDNRYIIHEEDILRQGLTVKTCYQRCRWYDGKVYTWLTRKATTGKGEGNSNVLYDTLGPKEIPAGLDLNNYVYSYKNPLGIIQYTDFEYVK